MARAKAQRDYTRTAIEARRARVLSDFAAARQAAAARLDAFVASTAHFLSPQSQAARFDAFVTSVARFLSPRSHEQWRRRQGLERRSRPAWARLQPVSVLAAARTQARGWWAWADKRAAKRESVEAKAKAAWLAGYRGGNNNNKKNNIKDATASPLRDFVPPLRDAFFVL